MAVMRSMRRARDMGAGMGRMGIPWLEGAERTDL